MSLSGNGRYARQSASFVPVIRRASLLLHPLVVFSVVWLGVVFLYSLHLSKLLIFSTEEVAKTVLIIWTPFVAVVLICTFLHYVLLSICPAPRALIPINFVTLERKLIVWFRIWMVISLFEIIISGGIPLLWLFQHSSKTYVDFGVSSLHGLVNSLLLSIGLCRFALFLLTGSRRHLVVPCFILGWSVLVVTRNMLLVAIIEFCVLFFRLKPVRKGTIIKLLAGSICFVLAFGAIGDYRSGSSDLIKLWAQPTENYPDWLPSGVLWGYIYISTPVNNLVYTSEIAKPVDSIAFPNTIATLFPTVIRKLIYGNQLGDTESGQLVAEAFNVSTAYVGPFQDYGFLGVTLFSMFTAAACQVFWFRGGLRDILIYVVLMQCLMLTLFFNHFLALPVISQAVWLYYFFRISGRKKKSLSESERSLDREPSLLT